MQGMRASELSERLGCEFVGRGDVTVRAAAPIDKAGMGDLTFYGNVKFKKSLATTKASVIIAWEDIGRDDITVILSENPLLTFARALHLLYPPRREEPFISPLASIHEEAEVSDLATVMHFACIEKQVKVEDHAVIHPGVYLGEGVTVGENSVLYPSVTVLKGCKIGKHVIIHPGAVIGTDGFGFVRHGERYAKVPQIGNVVLEDHVEVGANTTIDRAALGETRVREGSKLDNLVQVGHNVEIGKHSIIASQTGISGSVVIGDWVMLGGQTGVADHLEIDGGIMVAAKSGIPSSLSAKESTVWSGIPVIPHKKWLRLAGSLGKIPDLFRKVARLERELELMKREKGG